VVGGSAVGGWANHEPAGEQARANGVAMRTTKDRAGLRMPGCCILRLYSVCDSTHSLHKGDLGTQCCPACNLCRCRVALPLLTSYH
jgi:hypothetical protein